MGVKAHVTRDRANTAGERFEETVATHERSGVHTWVATVAYLVDPTAQTLLLDVENLAVGPEVGCYSCEQPYSRRLAERRCTGDPG